MIPQYLYCAFPFSCLSCDMLLESESHLAFITNLEPTNGLSSSVYVAERKSKQRNKQKDFNKALIKCCYQGILMINIKQLWDFPLLLEGWYPSKLINFHFYFPKYQIINLFSVCNIECWQNSLNNFIVCLIIYENNFSVFLLKIYKLPKWSYFLGNQFKYSCTMRNVTSLARLPLCCWMFGTCIVLSNLIIFPC